MILVWSKLATVAKNRDHNIGPRYADFFRIFSLVVISILGTKFHAWLRHFMPRYKILRLGTNIHAQVRNLTHRYEILHPGAKFYAQVRNLTPGNKISSPIKNLFARHRPLSC
jgi:hypothetical protein